MDRIIQIPVPVRPHKFPAIQHIVDLATAAHDRLLAAISSDIHRSLRNARGMEKGFYIDPKHTDVLMKAFKKPTAPKVKKVSAPKVKAAAGKKREAVKKPGSRGASEWYRDDHGIVRYGVRPSGNHIKAPMSQTEFDEWMKTSAPFFQFGQFDPLLQALDERGVPEFDVNFVNAVATQLGKMHAGQSIEDAFTESFTMANFGGAGDALKKFQDIQAKLEEAAKDPDIQKVLRDAAQAEANEQKKIIKEIEKDYEPSKNVFEKWLKSGPGEGGLGIVALAARMGIVFNIRVMQEVPKRIRKRLGEEFVKNNLIGRTWSDMPDNTDWLRFSDAMSPAQLAASVYAAKLAAKVFEKAGDHETAERMLQHAEDYTDALKKSYAGKTSAKDLDDKIDSMVERALTQTEKHDTNQGGSDVARVLSDTDTANAIISGTAREATIKSLMESDADFATRIEAALKAQENPDGSRQHSKAFNSSGKKPYPFQQKFINWMLSIKRGINAGDTAAGKTYQSIAMVDHLLETQKDKADGRGLMFLPPNLIAQWPQEIEKFRPGSETVVLDADDKEMGYDQRVTMLKAINDGKQKPDFILMSTGLLRLTKERSADIYRKMGLEVDDEDNITKGGEGDDGGLSAEQMAQFRKMSAEDPLIAELAKLKGAAFFDEAHTLGLKKPSNISYAIAKHVIGDREHAMMLTATPITNHPTDLYHMMELVSPGSAGGSLPKFQGKVGQWVRNEEGELVQDGFKDLSQFNAEVKPHVYARLKDEPEIAAQLKIPKSHERTLALKMFPEQQPYYDKARDELIDAFEHGGVSYNTQSERARRLLLTSQAKQCAISPKLLYGDSYKGRSAKFEAVKNQIREHFANPKNLDHPILIFCSFPKAFKWLQQEIMEELHLDESIFGHIYSEAPGGNKGRAVTAEAINFAKKKILFAGFASGGAGLNLQGVNVKDPKTGKETHVGPNAMIMLDKPYLPLLVEQARGRPIRPGQTEEVTTTHLRTLDSYEDELLENLHGKVEAARGILYAHLGEQELGHTTKRTVSQILADFAAAKGGGKSPEFEHFDEATQQATRDAMAGILGKDEKWKSNDQALAAIFGMDLSDPKWKAKREKISKMKPGELEKVVYDGAGLKRTIEERTYLAMEKTRLKTKMSVLELEFKDGKMTKDYYKEKKAGYEKALKVWEASKKAGKMLDDDLDLETALKANRKAGAAKGKDGPLKTPKVKEPKAKATKVAATVGKQGWQTKKSPYQKGSDEHALFERAHKLGAKNKEDFVKKYTARMRKLYKELDGYKGAQLESATATETKLAEKTWAKFVKDGHFVEKSIIVPLSDWLGARDVEG